MSVDGGKRDLGGLFEVSSLTLGGGGIGQVWGETTRDESIATVQAAYDGGINLYDMAPLYGRGEAETVLGLTFGDRYPDEVRVTTKCMLGTVPANDVLPKLERSLDESCERLRRDFIDVFVLHGYVVPDGFESSRRQELLPRIAVPLSLYREAVVPAFEALREEGRIGGWGITAAGPLDVNLAVLSRGGEPTPQVAQCIANVLDSPGSMQLDDETPDPRRVIKTARANGVGVMGIRAVAAGSLTDAVDRELDPASAEARDVERAAPLRALARELGTTTAALAHRYSLSMAGVDTVVLGVKNRDELSECLRAAEEGPLEAPLIHRIDALF